MHVLPAWSVPASSSFTIASSVLLVPNTVCSSCFESWPMMPCEPWPDEKIWKAA